MLFTSLILLGSGTANDYKWDQQDLIDDYFYKNSDKLEEYEINSAKNIIIKKITGMEEQELIQYLLKKGYKSDLVKQAIKEVGE